jgi:non-specific serine/threonine protein kinase
LVTAAQSLGAAQALLDTVGFQFPPEDRELFDEFSAAARARLGERAFARAWAEGRGMEIDRALAQAQALELPAPLDSPGSRQSRRATASDFSGLTRREREVAVLVRRGKTNRVIAEELVVSERTVEGHVNNILAKLGFRSRAQVAAWVVEKRLAKLPG